MSETLRVVAWTQTGHKPHLPLSGSRTLCGRRIEVTERRKVTDSRSDPVGGLCTKCEVAEHLGTQQ